MLDDRFSEATVVVSRADLEDMLEEWGYAALYKGEYLMEKHGDREQIAAYKQKYL